MTSTSMNVLTHLQQQKGGLVKRKTGRIAMVKVWTVCSLVARATLGPVAFRLLHVQLTTASPDRASSLAPFLKMCRVKYLRSPLSLFSILQTPLFPASKTQKEHFIVRENSLDTDYSSPAPAQHPLIPLSPTTSWMDANPAPLDCVEI